MDTCEVIIEVMIAISLGSLKYIQRKIMNH